MKGIETRRLRETDQRVDGRSDHCPAMKGIETCGQLLEQLSFAGKRPLPRNEGD